MADPYNLQRFVDAQQPVYARVVDELRAGEKRSHWMWFIFPQIEGIGRSPMAQLYAITGLDEARDYLAHPLLGPRLRECTAIVNGIQGKTLDEIFGYPDNLKFCSSMTLFARAAQDNELFRTALRKYCDDQPDPQTIARLPRD
uniref:Calpastatin n=1 Tax=Burkholderia sp. (strain CCGE1003) TaxID=640512 RepID=E1TI07_BURSG